MWCSAIQVSWIKLKNKLTTGAAWCPVSNTEFLRKGVLFNKQDVLCADVLTEIKVYFHAYYSSVKLTFVCINFFFRQFVLKGFHNMHSIKLLNNIHYSHSESESDSNSTSYIESNSTSYSGIFFFFTLYLYSAK